ncbi:thioredoxin domain-containing protein [Sphingomonas sp. PAMC 26605]|uniref:thioredoxin domain-containing protein n=1 Tax=Sphingomonas sp. PAMC 26605 TaxID=1112214 RepID=UPI00026CDCE8|nr:thioredoxin domain-containing protein [Sphingomonas sp. PAMC 26605]
MTPRILLSAVAALSLAACGGSGTSADGNVAAAAPVAAKPAPAGQNWTQVVSKTPEGGYRMGNPDAAIKLVEYGSRTCPTCGAFGQTGQKPLTDNYVSTGKVSYEFRDYLVHGQPDFAPSLLGRCVGTATFFPLLEAMYMAQPQFEAKLADQAATNALQTQLQGKTPNEAAAAWGDYLGYVEWVKQRGIPEAKARACIADKAALDEIIGMMNKGEGASVTGTPTFILNGTKVDGVSWPDVEAALKRAGA